MSIADNCPLHYLNEGDPDLIVAAITDVVRCVRDGSPLGESLTAAEASDGQ
jgi:hypothetical protein